MTVELPGPLASGEWLAAHLERVHVADVRWYLDGRSGRDAYDAGHVPGAVWVDLDRDLAGPPSPAAGRHPLPDPQAFAAALGRLGIGEDRPVVAYDDASGSVAARLWWMLDAIGQPAAVLDGGLAAWPGPLETSGSGDGAVGALRPVFRAVRPWPAAGVASIEEVDRVRRDAGPGPGAGAVLLDARAPARYEGAVEPVDARPGHIPGARNHPWAANLDDDGRFLPGAELRRRLATAGVTGGDQVVVASCGSGVTACHDLLALRLAFGAAGGVRGVLYPGSWSQWAADPSRPAATGAARG